MNYARISLKLKEQILRFSGELSFNDQQLTLDY